MVKQIIPGVFSFYIPLPDSPLKNLNCYVIKTPVRNLIIDTGFNRPECYQALIEGLNELDINMNETDLFLTHVHSDHCGLAPQIATKNTKVYMSREDSALNIGYNEKKNTRYWDDLEEVYVKENFPAEGIIQLRKRNPARVYAAREKLDYTIIEDGTKINLNGLELECVFTPGHSPGHMCLYVREQGIMFLGDHVLFDITPNITVWNKVPNSLEIYIDSLNKISKFDVKIPLPAHRNVSEAGFYGRIDEIKAHHVERLQDAWNAINQNEGIDAYGIAGKMKWSIRAKNWEEFPLPQKWFAVGEALAHINYLLKFGKVKKELINGVYRYSVTDTIDDISI